MSGAPSGASFFFDCAPHAVTIWRLGCYGRSVTDKILDLIDALPDRPSADKNPDPIAGIRDIAKRAFDNLTPKEQRVLRMNFGLGPASEDDSRLAREAALHSRDAWLERLRSKTSKKP